MPKPGRPKKKPPIETSDDDESIGETPIERNGNKFLFSSSFLSPPTKKGEKREHPQTSPEKEHQKPAKKTIKPTTTTDSIPSISFPSLSPEQYLQKALESLTQAYKGLEEKEKKEQVKQLEDYTRSILVGENPFIQGKEKAGDVLKGLVEEVRALRKEVAPIKETYAERLKRDLLSSSSLPSLLPSSSSTPSPFSRSSTSTRSKKKQL